MCKLEDTNAVEKLQPHDLEAELGLRPKSSGPHEWKWMRLAVLLRRQLHAVEARLDALEKKGSYYGRSAPRNLAPRD